MAADSGGVLSFIVSLTVQSQARTQFAHRAKKGGTWGGDGAALLLTDRSGGLGFPGQSAQSIHFVTKQVAGLAFEHFAYRFEG